MSNNAVRQRDLEGRRPLRSLTDVARGVLDRYGGRLAKDQMVDAVKEDMSIAEYDRWREGAFRKEISAAATERISTGRGVYRIKGDVVRPAQMTFEEMRSKAFEAAKLSVDNEATVYLWAEKCEEIHGRTFDPESLISEARSA